MSLDKLKEYLKVAMKGRDEFATGVLRMLVAALHNVAIEKRAKVGSGELTDDEVLIVLQREAKKRREAAVLFEKGNRPELKERELKEADFIERYLPKQLGEKEIEEIVAKVLASGLAGYSSVMREVMKDVKGRARGNVVSGIIKKHLGQ